MDETTPGDFSTEPDFLASARVAILGLGLIGGSLALALRGRCAALLGVDPDHSTLDLATRLEVFTALTVSPAEVLSQADVIILTAPVKAILELIGRLPELAPGPAIILDVGSTKVQVVEALSKLPERFDPIGGHPMCGKEKGGLVNAEAALFQGAPFAFIPLERTSTRARAFARRLAAALGARPLWIDPATHDRWTAATSHLPYLVSAALSLATPVEAATLVGPGFRSATRLAASDPEMMGDVLGTNSENLLVALARLRESLGELEMKVREGDLAALEGLLRKAARSRRALVEPDQDLPQAEGRQQ